MGEKCKSGQRGLPLDLACFATLFAANLFFEYNAGGTVARNGPSPRLSVDH
jgi:hypothetical protein